MASAVAQGLQSGLNLNPLNNPNNLNNPSVPYVPPAPAFNTPPPNNSSTVGITPNQLQQRLNTLTPTVPNTNRPTTVSGVVVDATASLHKRARDGTIVRWALMFLFITAIVSLVSVLQIHNAQTTSTCWSTTVADAMAIACVVVAIIVCVMIGVTYLYYTAQPRAYQAERSFFYPPFVFFAFLTLVALVSWIMIVDVTAKGRASTTTTGTSGTCLNASDYNAGVAGALMALVVSMIGTIAAYHWSK
jgi:hypothetical protein